MATQSDDAPTAPMRDQPGGHAALLIIDMINPFDFAGGARVQHRALRAAHVIAALRRRVEAAGCPVIYVNDNFGEWHSERARLVERVAGNPVAAAIAPGANDYFIIKPQFSGFYATNLPVLLPKLGVDRLILTGVATEMCVFLTAADAHMRDYALWVPADAVAAVDDAHGDAALAMMAANFNAETHGTDRAEEWLATLEPAASA